MALRTGSFYRSGSFSSVDASADGSSGRQGSSHILSSCIPSNTGNTGVNNPDFTTSQKLDLLMFMMREQKEESVRKFQEIKEDMAALQGYVEARLEDFNAGSTSSSDSSKKLPPELSVIGNYIIIYIYIYILYI